MPLAYEKYNKSKYYRMPRLFQVTLLLQATLLLGVPYNHVNCKVWYRPLILQYQAFAFFHRLLESKLTNPFSFKLSMVSLMLISSGINSMPKLLIFSFDTWYVGTNGLSSAHLQRSAHLVSYLFCKLILQAAVCRS
jgi:hypothetical protein